MINYTFSQPVTTSSQNPRADLPLVELRDVSKVFKTSAGDYSALKKINLSYGIGEFAAIMGKSGSGKSTLINMITGIDHPTSGSVRVDGAEVHKMTQGQLAVWRGRNLGIVFQFFQLLPTMSVLENTLLAMDFSNVVPPAEREERAIQILKLVDLDTVADKLPAALSGGQQQIAAIARALANDPPMIVADEPTGNLDSRTAAHILEIFDDLAAQGKTILIVTHDNELARHAHRRVLISDGELINEYVSQALPTLPNSLMLKLTHQLEQRTYQPGVTIARQGALDAGLFVITRGYVEILRQGARGAIENLDRLGPGQYFSELDMIETMYCDLSYLAAPDDLVEILCLNQIGFNRLINEIPKAGIVFHQTAVERSALYCPKRPLHRTWKKLWRRRQ
jgi:ABC-type lipoprotein export system ATPase subunit